LTNKGKILLITIFLIMMAGIISVAAELPNLLEISQEEHRQNGKVVGIQPDKLVGSPGDCIFINRGKDNGIKIGDQFYVYRPTAILGGNLEGVSAPIAGMIEIVDVQLRTATAIVKDFMMPILPEDYVHFFQEGTGEIREKVRYFLLPETSSLDATVVGTPGNRILLTVGDEIFLDRGNGKLGEGEIMYLYRPGSLIKDPVTREYIGVPVEVLGIVEILHVGVTLSRAKISQFYQFAKVGDRVAMVTEIPFYPQK